ncbi:MAG: pullulanase-type alpha-1,6-glucosidase [Caldilineaceae bacterium]|nr:pullulanase-type alpha-1,6-glucosidase [Caldilineaceae bacterium]
MIPFPIRRQRRTPLLNFILIFALFVSLLPAGMLAAPPAQDEANTATIHYHRPDGNYEGWGLHVWEDTIEQVMWTTPLPPAGEDDFGLFWTVRLAEDAERLGFIVHKGDEKDPGPDQFLDLTQSRQAWILSGDTNVYTTAPDPNAILPGDITRLAAYWVDATTILWNVNNLPDGATVALHSDPNAGMSLTQAGISGQGYSTLPLTPAEGGPSAEIVARFPHLANYAAFTLPADAPNPALLVRNQLAVTAITAEGELLDAAGLQIPGVLDDVLAYSGELGVVWDDEIPTLKLWAPTAKNVRLFLYGDDDDDPEIVNMRRGRGEELSVWSVTGEADWKGRYYLYEVRVFVPSTGRIETNLVTDPYSFSLAVNSRRSQIVDLNDPALKPDGWDELTKPPLEKFEDISIYELHVRDFSVYDETVPEELRGTYLAFTVEDGAGVAHLRGLAEAGLTHLHLLPTFDIATIDEVKENWIEPDPAELAALPPDSPEQQAIIYATRDEDGFNWGYDPFHYTVPEGSYSTDPASAARILEYRQMVQALNGMGLRLVVDVVYNHTNAAGQAEKSVLDKIVPGYYHRLNAVGIVETSTCCSNTATEHAMMEKLMLDSLETWATQYKVDGFRFDLMGHHMLEEMVNVRALLDSLTEDAHGVDGSKIYVYGEGWDFGEVAANARGVNATQLNAAGTGIGTFNDRLRDAVRGVGPFDTGEAMRKQGFISGLYLNPNEVQGEADEADLRRLLHETDWIRIGMAGNLADYVLVDSRGAAVTGAEISYNGAPAGYTLDPQESINYASAHDNQTLYDALTYGAPQDTPMGERVKMQQLALSIVALGQGVPFFHAGSDMLRSKSFDRDSYNSGDWFNALDWSYTENNFGKGLPVADKNEGDWPIMAPLLADPNLKPGPVDIASVADYFRILLEIRRSTPLLRLQTAEQIMRMVRFHNSGPDQIPGLIVQSIIDVDGEGVAPDRAAIFVLINARPDDVDFTVDALAGTELRLHPLLAMRSSDLGRSAFDAETGTFTIPGRVAVVFEASELSEGLTTFVADFDAEIAELIANPPDLPAEETPAAEIAIESVGFPGNYVAQIGGADWSPDHPSVQAADEDGDGVWTLTVQLPPGSYEFKAAVNGSWAINFGLDGERDGPNVPLEITGEGGIVTFFFNTETNEVYAEIGAAEAEPQAEAVLGDGQIGRGGLFHDSRSDLYRLPFGAVAENTEVTLRFRTLAGDVESVRLLTVNEATGVRATIPMILAATTQEGYDWWETTINTGAAPTIHTYAFEIADGDTLLYYIDSALDGGAGNVSDVAPPPGIRAAWDIYTYFADFEAPDWAKNAVIYQIFPDRFRNGRVENDPTADDWFYPEERGRAFPIAPWNTIVPDPQPNDPGANPAWYATWNSTFYGGDLQGILEKLDYLQELGVTALYLNPIFESPSNHRYDGRSFDQVDPRLGIEDDAEASLAVLEELGRAAEERGMKLILDGVPNHLSSDAFIFDRYRRHATEGACESADSPFREWFFFHAAQPEGSGPCAADTDYEQWAGVYTLPQLDNTNEEVIDNWLGEDGVAVRWLRIPGVEGWRIDVVPDVAALNPDFFRFFRNLVKAEYPDAILYSETWWEPEVRGRVLGDEFDSTMNYRFRNAVLGFLRDGDWEDGDGMIPALTPSQFESALRAIEEDYPPAAWATAMNLISSHDVNRAVRVLDHDGVDYGALEPVNNFEDGRQRLVLAAVLQFTLPGAPTVYYGDEVGLVGFGSDIPRDDPYNRQPYPWPDEDGYADLPQWRQQHEDLLAHYQFLGRLRGEHSFLRTGAWTTFSADDATGLYVYGRKDDTGAAVIAINRGDAAATVDLNLTGFVPLAATLINAATGEETTTPLSAEVGPMDFAIWLVETETDLSLPDAPLLVSAAAGDSFAALEIEMTDPTVTHLLIYRSPVDGGYALIEQIGVDEPGVVTFTEGGLPNGQPVYYRFSSLRASGMESPLHATVRLIPSVAVAAAALIDPMQIEHVISAITPTLPLQGRIVIDGDAQAAGVIAELGLIRVEPDVIPALEDAIWVRGESVGETDGSMVYAAQVLPDAPGTYLYGWRFSTTGGESWIYADISGIVTDLPWSAPGQLTVIPGEDTDPPNRPFRISEVFASPTQIVVEWRASRTADLHHYRVCRRDVSAGETDPCARAFIVPRESQILTDTAVVVDHVYEYQVQSVDTSFNRSEPSDVLAVTAAENFVEVTFRVRVPDFTPAEDVIVIAGDNRDVFGGQWNPVQPMTEVEENVWSFTAIVKEGTPLQYKYTRGSWETVEQWGAVAGMANRPTAVVASPEGTMVIDNTRTDWGEGEDSTKAIRNWRDPLVVSTTAEDGAITVVFNSAVVPTAALDEVITVTDAGGATIPGAVAQTDQDTFTFTPAAALSAGSITVTVFNVATDVGMMRPFVGVIGD